MMGEKSPREHKISPIWLHKCDKLDEIELKNLIDNNVSPSDSYNKVILNISSSSSCRAASTDIPDPLSPRLPSGLHPVSSHSCCMYVRADRPAFDWPYAGVHRSTSLTISSLLLQQCPACRARLACIVFVTGGRWPYSWRLVGCCCQDLFNIARNILVSLPSSFFSNRLVSVQYLYKLLSFDSSLQRDQCSIQI